MNRIWVSLWLGIMGALLGFGILFQVAKGLTSFFIGETAVPIWGSLGGVVFATLLAALIAWRLAEPLSEVSRAARQVAGGDLSARATLSSKQQPWFWNRQDDEATRLLYDFNAMAASLERLEAERQATAAAIAHELRTPIAVLRARLAALRDGVFTLNQGELPLLIQQTDLLVRSVDDLRSLSLADAGKLELTFAPSNLATLVREAVGGSEYHTAEKGVALNTALENVVVTCDEVRLRQVVSNVLGNALKFTPRGGVVTLSVEAVSGGATLKIRDTGPGFAEGEEKKVFERFHHGESSSSSGLGLAIVKTLVELHGGFAEATNPPEGGALIELFFPEQHPLTRNTR